ncbi:hypothetical protein MNBD_GAMMA17-25, partial [hydrothermal vent metagenome]
LLLFGLSGCWFKPAAIGNSAPFSGAGGHVVHVISHGWHTGLVVPAKEIQARIPALQDQFGDVGSLEFGWGDKGFYQAEEITTGLTVRAVLWPTESVMHVVAVPQSPREYFPDSEVITFCLTDSALSSLMQFIASSFKRNDTGDVVSMKSGVYGNSQFYQGEGDYYLMNTCNKWTAKGLRSAGMNISPTFKLTADSVMGYLKKEMSSLLLVDGVVACR